MAEAPLYNKRAYDLLSCAFLACLSAESEYHPEVPLHNKRAYDLLSCAFLACLSVESEHHLA